MPSVEYRCDWARQTEDTGFYKTALGGKAYSEYTSSNSSVMVYPYSDESRYAAKATLRVYIDHYNDPIADGRLFAMTFSAAAAADGSEETKRPSLPFPQLLYQMLEQASSLGFDHVVSWATHGRAFRIHHKQQFEKFVLPKYFQTKRLSSFVRQLFLYKFHRSDVGRNEGSWFHEYFLRGRPDLTSNMNRESKRSHEAAGRKGVRPGRSASRTWNVDLYKLQPCLQMSPVLPPPSLSPHQSFVASNVPLSLPDHRRKSETSTIIAESSSFGQRLSNDPVSLPSSYYQQGTHMKKSNAHHKNASGKTGALSDMDPFSPGTKPFFDSGHDFSSEWSPEGGYYSCDSVILEVSPSVADDVSSLELLKSTPMTGRCQTGEKEDAAARSRTFATSRTAIEGNAVTADSLRFPHVDTNDSTSFQPGIQHQAQISSNEELLAFSSSRGGAGSSAATVNGVISHDDQALNQLQVFGFPCTVADVGRLNTITGQYHL